MALKFSDYKRCNIHIEYRDIDRQRSAKSERAIAAFNNPSVSVRNNYCEKIPKPEGRIFNTHNFVTKRRYWLFKYKVCTFCGHEFIKEKSSK